MPKPRLATIGPSHYCEKARWGLERARIGFVEEAHVPVFHYAASLVRHGQRTTPLLITPHGTMRDSTDILRHADKFVEATERLFPMDPALLSEVDAWEDIFDRKLGPATRRLAYFHIIDDAEAMRGTLGARVPATERALLGATLPAVVAFLRWGLRIDAEGAAKSEERLTQVFDEVEARLADGRRYLVGERFSAADLTFAALAAPVLLPPEYGWPLPRLDECPADLRAFVDRFRSRPAGRFALGLYEHERRRSVPTAVGA